MTQEPCKKCGEYHNNCYELAELTDEEIWKLWSETRLRLVYDRVQEFAKAILRKAQEK